MSSLSKKIKGLKDRTWKIHGGEVGGGRGVSEEAEGVERERGRVPGLLYYDMKAKEESVLRGKGNECPHWAKAFGLGT